MKPINVKSVTTDSQATTAVSIKGNLPSQVTGQATPGSPYISTSDYFTPLGDRERLTYQWQPTSTPNQYDLTILGDNGSPIGSASVTFSDSGPNAGRPLSYTNIVDLSTAPASFGINPATGVATLTINNGTTPQVLTLSMGAPNTLEGITQFAGDYTPQEVTRNGSSASELARTEIGEDGFVRGIFTNGETRILFQIPIADVRNPNGLLTKDGNAYALSNKSGAFSLSDAGVSGKGEVLSNTLEMSNVDLALELTDLIQAQRSYSSSAKIITTADEMLDETTRLKR
jgi:flagellar hook protein FlgE